MYRRTLFVDIPKIPEEKYWGGMKKRIVYYIAPNQNITLRYIDTSEKRILLTLGKLGVFPVLTCVVINDTFFFDTNGSIGCAAAAGGIYPYDVSELNNMKLYYGKQAEVSRLLLLLHRYKGRIGALNINKLYQTIDKKAPLYFIDKHIFFNAINKNKLSTYAIKEQKQFDIHIPSYALEWVNNWTQVSHKNFFVKADNIVRLSKGGWIFLNPNGKNYGIIFVGENGKTFFKEY